MKKLKVGPYKILYIVKLGRGATLQTNDFGIAWATEEEVKQERLLHSK